MNRDKKILYAISMLFVCALLLVLFVPVGPLRIGALSGVAAAFFVATILFIKKRSILDIEKKQIYWILPMIGVVALLTYYLTGFKLGFLPTGFDPTKLLTFVLPCAVIIVLSEYLRSVFLQQSSRIVDIICFVSFVLLDIAMLQEKAVFGRMNNFVDFMGTVLLPSLTANILYHYTSKKYGMIPVAIYKLIFCTYSYFIAYTPSYPSVLYSFIKILLPVSILWFVNLLFEKRRFSVSRKKIWISTAATVIGIALMALWLMLLSCKFKYGILVVATESMTGSINKGDAIVYCEYDGEIIEEGQVLVFDKGGITTIHRVVGIDNINGELRYYTKGDALDEMDSGYITEENIIGTTDMTIKYIGYPTLWMRQFFK